MPNFNPSFDPRQTPYFAMPKGEFPTRPADLADFGKLLRTAHKSRPAAGGTTLTLDELARRTGISKPYLSNIETARAPGPPSEEKLKLLAAALELDAASLMAAADWLRTPESVRRAFLGVAGGVPRRGDGAIDLDRMVGNAKGEMRKAKPGAGEGGNITHGDTFRTKNVPLINRVAAGVAGEFGDLSYPAGVADAYVPAPDLPEAPAGQLFAVKVVGDSMLPEYREGDILIVGPGEAKDGDDCVVRTGALENFATTFKRVFFVRDGEGEAEAVRLVPLNPAYPERVLALEEVTGIYPLVYRMVPARVSKGGGMKASEKLKGG